MTAPQATNNNIHVSTEDKRLKLTHTSVAANNNNAMFLEDGLLPLSLDFCLSPINIFNGHLQGNKLMHVNKPVYDHHHYWVQYIVYLSLNQRFAVSGSIQ